MSNVTSTLSDYISVEERLPECVELPNAFGVQVEVLPTMLGSVTYYGCRVTDKPAFYRYGAVVEGITHWRYANPVNVETDGHGRYVYHTSINPAQFWQALQEKVMEMQRSPDRDQATINSLYTVLANKGAMEALVDVASASSDAEVYWQEKQLEAIRRDIRALKNSIAEFDRVVENGKLNF